MKTICFNRHAKSSWAEAGIADIDRPLNPRGLRDAPFMGNLLSKKIESPQLIFSSPANRAISTAKIYADSFNYNQNKIVIDKNIYSAVVSDLMRIIYSVSDNLNRIMFFGHNPTFTQISNYLSDKFIDNLPTCGFVQIDFDLNTWKEIEGKTGKIILFEYPKKYFNED